MNSFHQTMFEMSFPYYESKTIEFHKRLGSGHTGDVYSGKLSIGEFTKECVIKRLSSSNYETTKQSLIFDDFTDEVSIGRQFMNKTNHQIQFYGYSVDQSENDLKLYLLMEKTSANCDMESFIHDNKNWKRITKNEYDNSSSSTVMYQGDTYWDYIVPTTDKLKIMNETAKAIQELHTFDIVHCDLKPNNMLVVGNTVKLIDFNASYELNGETEIEGTAEIGTSGYMAPELYNGWISYKTDIYSLGVTMLEIWFGDIWPTITDDYKQCRKYVLDYLHLLKKDNVQLYQLIKNCVSTDSTKRPSIKKIITNLHHILGVVQEVV